MGLLKDCHSNNPFMRYLGTCNDTKLVLNKCFRAEVRPAALALSDRPGFLTPSSTLARSPCAPDRTEQRIQRGKANLDAARAKRTDLEKAWKEIDA